MNFVNLNKSRNLKLIPISFQIICFLISCKTTTKSKSDINLKRNDILIMATETREQIYKHYPQSKLIRENSAGSAVFSNFGFKVMFMGSTNGEGVVFNNSTNQITFMKMRELHPGFGFGAQKFKLIFVFDTQDSLENFINSGWEFSGQLFASANYSNKGNGFRLGASVSKGVTMYQLSETGFIIGISLAGAKYFKDDELN